MSVAARGQVLSFFLGIFSEGWRRDYEQGIVTRPPNELVMRAMIGAAEALALWFLETDPPTTAEEATERLLDLLRAYCPWSGKRG